MEIALLILGICVYFGIGFVFTGWIGQQDHGQEIYNGPMFILIILLWPFAMCLEAGERLAKRQRRQKEIDENGAFSGKQ